MTAPEFDPELVEQAARALYKCSAVYDTGDAWEEMHEYHEGFREMALAVLTAVAPTLRAEGAPWARCTGASDCPEEWHEHGCFSDDCQCSDPNDHDGWDAGYQRGKVDGAREVLTDAKAELAAMRPATDVNRLQLSRKHREDELERLVRRRTLNDVLELLAAREAVARIEKGIE